MEKISGRDHVFYRYITKEGEDSVRIKIIGDNARRAILAALPTILKNHATFAQSVYSLELEYSEKRKAKTELVKNFLRLSPASLLANTLSAVSKTDLAAYDRFITLARQYRDSVISYIRSRGGYSSARWFTADHEQASYRGFVAKLESLTRSEIEKVWLAEYFNSEKYKRLLQEINNDPRRKLDLHDMPRFRMRHIALSESLPGVALDIVILLLIPAVCVAAAVIRFAGYDPR
jgi:hypothetical protein